MFGPAGVRGGAAAGADGRSVRRVRRRRARRPLRRLLRGRGRRGRDGRRRSHGQERPPQGGGRRGDPDPGVRRGGVRRAARADRAPAPDVRDLHRHRAPGRHHADHLQRLPGRGRGPPGPPVDPGPDGDRHAVSPLRRHRRGDHRRRARTAGARAGAARSASFVVDVPAGVDEGSTLRLPGRGAGGMPRRARRRPVRAPAGAQPSDPDPTGRRPAGGGARGHDPGRARDQLPVRDPRRRRGARPSRAAPRAAGSSGCGAGACPTCRAGAAAT